MDSKRSINAAYESYAQEFEDEDTFKKWLFRWTGTKAAKYQFCWKDKFNDKPWEVCKAPPEIPKFRLEYGMKEEAKPQKRGRKRKRRPLKPNAYSQNFGVVMKQARMAGSGEKLLRQDMVGPSRRK